MLMLFMFITFFLTKYISLESNGFVQRKETEVIIYLWADNMVYFMYLSPVL